MLIDMRPRHDYCSVNLGETASYDLWIEFRNLSPFDVEIDRAEVKFHCAGTTHKSAILEKVQIEAGHVWVYYAQENIGDGQANHIAKNMDNHQSAIELVVEFNCSLHSFKHLTGRLEGVKPRFVNANQRVA
ncbi:MAG: hypothetical protein HOC70_04425 [Gammaproteobacteria bacterium]|nr:hypothetical protein [Gammaproteobacteria bacterium]